MNTQPMNIIPMGLLSVETLLEDGACKADYEGDFRKFRYAMARAWENAEKATCLRRKVGAVFMNNDGVVVAGGFNTAPPGMPTCLEVGCLSEQHDVQDVRCIRTIHAEKVARLHLDLQGIRPQGLTLAITCRPCYVCARDLASWKIARVIYSGESPTGWTYEVLRAADIQLLRIDKELLC